MTSTRGIIELEDEAKADEFHFHQPVRVPWPWPGVPEYQEGDRVAHFVVTKVDRENGIITMEALDDGGQ